MAKKDRRDEIIELQNQLIRARARGNLLRVDEDLWGARPAETPELSAPAGETPSSPVSADTPAAGETPAVRDTPAVRETPTSGETPAPEAPRETPHPALTFDPPRFPAFPAGETTDELMRLIRESAESLTQMTEDLNRRERKGTGALPDIPLKEQPVLNSKAAPAPAPEAAEETPPEDIEELKKELHGYIGLDLIKQEVDSLINYVTIMQRRREAGLPAPDMSLHMVFSGNPGTGKTMIARLMARIYRSLGILSKGHLVETDRSGLVAGYVGQTAIKTKEVIDSAKGGVLFIDEAYTLTNRGGGQDFGQEAVDTLLKAMEDMRDDLIVIVAGYTELMAQFVNSNPGLKSRFNRFMEFPDYTTDELMAIFDMRCEKSGYRLKDDEAREALRERVETERVDVNGFGNARGVRNLFEKALSRQADRLAAMPDITREDLETLSAEDIRKA